MSEHTLPSHESLVSDVKTRNEQKAEPFFTGRVGVYPKVVDGKIRKIKWIALGVILFFYYALPWLRWDRGPNAPDQALLVDMAGRRAYFFNIEIWPQEVYYLTGILIISSFLLFLVTSLAGRVWCGFSCPQTVWTDLFMWVEQKIEGDRNARIRLDKAPFSVSKLRKRATKHFVWVVIALLTGGAWAMYFQDAPTLVVDFFTGRASTATYFFIGLFSATTYLLAGLAREQVCTYMCPWPRIQGALLDDESMVVTYREDRGEPRGPFRKGQDWDQRGDCIDCKQCVAACPTGIDIRDGIQLECIGCGLCIDACDEIMEKINRPLGLVAFDNEKNKDRRRRGEEPVYRLIRPRTILYSAILLLVVAVFFISLFTRDRFEVNIQHDRNPLFVTLSNGDIRNGYTMKLLQMERESTEYVFTIDGLPDGTQITVQGHEPAVDGIHRLPVRPDQVNDFRVFVAAPRDGITEDVIEIDFVLTGVDGRSREHETVFRGP